MRKLPPMILLLKSNNTSEKKRNFDTLIIQDYFIDSDTKYNLKLMYTSQRRVNSTLTTHQDNFENRSQFTFSDIFVHQIN